MIFVSRGTKTIDITPAGWGVSHTGASSFFARGAALMTMLGAEDMPHDLREFVGAFSDVQVSVQRVKAVVLVRSDLTDEEVDARCARLARHLSSGVAHAVAEFSEDGSVRLLESHGPIEIGTREPCAAGHVLTEECDLCRGLCLGGGEHPPAAALGT